jgi:hypothetical protein
MILYKNLITKRLHGKISTPKMELKGRMKFAFEGV